VKVIERIYSPKDTKSMIGQADIYFSGRMHAGVGAMSQSVPTVLVAYGHKHIGISRLVGQEEFVFQGGSPYELRDLAQRLWENRNRCREVIKNRMPHVESLLHLSFEMLREATSLEKTQMGKIPDNVIEKWQKEIEDVKNDQRLVLPVY
jgi:colanic acid/amylovoran biosynthesis protein